MFSFLLLGLWRERSDTKIISKSSTELSHILDSFSFFFLFFLFYDAIYSRHLQFSMPPYVNDTIYTSHAFHAVRISQTTLIGSFWAVSFSSTYHSHFASHDIQKIMTSKHRDIFSTKQIQAAASATMGHPKRWSLQVANIRPAGIDSGSCGSFQKIMHRSSLTAMSFLLTPMYIALPYSIN